MVRLGRSAGVPGQDGRRESDLLVDGEAHPVGREGAPPVPGGHLRHQPALQHGGRLLAAQPDAHLVASEPRTPLDLEPDAGRQQRRRSLVRRRRVLPQADAQPGTGLRRGQVALVRRVEVGGPRPRDRPPRVVHHLLHAAGQRTEHAGNRSRVDEVPVLEFGRHGGQSTMRPKAAMHISSSVDSPRLTSTGSSRPCSSSARRTYGFSIVLS